MDDSMTNEELEKEYGKDIRPLTEKDIREMSRRRTEGIPLGITFKNGFNSPVETLTLNTGINIACAMTGHGKTSFLNNVALKLSTEGDGQDGSVIYFSYEISKGELVADLIGTYVGRSAPVKDGVSVQDAVIAHFKGDDSAILDPKKWKEKEHELVSTAFESGRLLVVDKSYSAETLVQALMYYTTKVKAKAVLIDYAQMLYSEAMAVQRTQEIKYVVGGIAAYANENCIPVLMAAQFNRQVSSPASMAERNIGEGGDFSRIANTIIGIYNLERLEPALSPTEDKETANLMYRLGEPCQDTRGDIVPIRNKMLFKLIKRRGGQAGLYSLVGWDGRTKRLDFW